MQMTLPRKPIELKISTIVAVSAILRETDLAVLDVALKEMTGGTPDFFDDEFTVIDVGLLDLSSLKLDWPSLIALLKNYHLNPVAVRNAPPELHSSILAQGLSLDVVTQSQEKIVAPELASSPAISITSEPVVPLESILQTPAATILPQEFHTMIVDTPVRAGQRIYARGADLVITAGVNNGAEVIADGSIHIYGPLRGRALAGASGYPGARIFTMSMEAELVSIAGMYRTFENDLAPDLIRRATQIQLIDERIDIQPIRSLSKS
ncbi:MAG: septum site-determining protein MinC [Pseudomonadota bacterium]